MDGEGSSMDNEPEDDWKCLDGSMSVFDMAVMETEKNPESSILLAERLFGNFTGSDNPCKSCLGLHKNCDERKKALATSEAFKGWSLKDFDKIKDTCPTHYVTAIMEERETQKAEKEEQRQKLAARRRNRNNKRRRKKKNGIVKENEVNGDMQNDTPPDEDEALAQDDDDDLATFLLNRNALPKPTKKRIRWECPYCNKSSKYSSCGCVQCGNWYHYACVGFRAVHEIPNPWVCHSCYSR